MKKISMNGIKNIKRKCLSRENIIIPVKVVMPKIVNAVLMGEDINGI